jgi:hypothetical protein
MFYSGSVSPPREPPHKKFIVPPRTLSPPPSKKMGGADASGSGHRVHEGSLMWPMLTRSNYVEWATLMKCNFEILEVWEAIKPGGEGVKRTHDRQAMGGILRSVPQEMWQMLGSKKTVKEAWEAVKSMRVGAERVKEANAQRLLQEFENIAFKDGETADDFALRINALAADLCTSGEAIEDARVVKKMLRVLPKRYQSIAISIETLLDLKTLTIEELVGRLKMVKDHLGIETVTDKTSKLLLTEEDWVVRNRHQLISESSSSFGGEKKTERPKFSGGGGRGERGDRGEKKEPVVKLTTMGTPRRKGRCRNCGIYGHWAEDCKKPKRERKEEAHIAQADTEQPSILLATVNAVRVHRRDAELSVGRTSCHIVHLNEEKVFLAEQEEHMTGRREVLSSLDTSVGGTVRFGDGSLVDIKGIGSVLLQTKKNGHKVLSEVYFIPKLKSTIVSLGQLEEGGCKVVLENGYCNVFDVSRSLLARAPRVKNRLYLLKMQLAAPVCLVAKANDQAWLWHGLSQNRPNYKSTSPKTIAGAITFSNLSPYNSGSP